MKTFIYYTPKEQVIEPKKLAVAGLASLAILYSTPAHGQSSSIYRGEYFLGSQLNYGFSSPQSQLDSIFSPPTQYGRVGVPMTISLPQRSGVTYTSPKGVMRTNTFQYTPSSSDVGHNIVSVVARYTSKENLSRSVVLTFMVSLPVQNGEQVRY